MNATFDARRRRVLAAISPGAMLLYSAPVLLRNNDVEHEYRQDSDFYYLAGFDEPESALLLMSGPHAKTVVFLRERNPERETWDGPRLGVERAASALGVNEAYPIASLPAKLPELLVGCERLLLLDGIQRRIRRASHLDVTAVAFDDSTRRFVANDACRSWNRYCTKCDFTRKRSRWVRCGGRLKSLSQAHRAVFAATRAGQWEYEIEALLRAEFRKRGAERVAYSPIVASGINATVLHHRSNDRQSLSGELILVDAGCEYGYQSADITRTFPASGRFSPCSALPMKSYWPRKKRQFKR